MNTNSPISDTIKVFLYNFSDEAINNPKTVESWLHNNVDGVASDSNKIIILCDTSVHTTYTYNYILKTSLGRGELSYNFLPYHGDKTQHELGSASHSNSYFSSIYRNTPSGEINSRIKEIVDDSFDVVIDMPRNKKLSDSYYSDKLPSSITTSYTLVQIKNILSNTGKEFHKNKFGNLGGRLKTQSPTSYWTI